MFLQLKLASNKNPNNKKAFGPFSTLSGEP